MPATNLVVPYSSNCRLHVFMPSAHWSSVSIIKSNHFLDDVKHIQRHSSPKNCSARLGMPPGLSCHLPSFSWLLQNNSVVEMMLSAQNLVPCWTFGMEEQSNFPSFDSKSPSISAVSPFNQYCLLFLKLPLLLLQVSAGPSFPQHENNIPPNEIKDLHLQNQTICVCL